MPSQSHKGKNEKAVYTGHQSSVQTPFPIDRWLSERPEEAPWNNLGGVFGSDQGTASDGNNVKKNTWSNVAVDGMSKASGSRYKLHHGSNNNRK